MRKDEHFVNNTFSMYLLDCTQKSIDSLMKNKEFKLGQNNHHLLSETEKYISRVSKISNDLKHVFEQINHVKIYVRRYPYRKFYKENGIRELDYIQYHMEALFHKIHTILEIMKLMVNEVYALGIQSRDCSWNMISVKLDKNTNSLQIVEKYYKTFKVFIDTRHVNTHRGIYNDPEQEEIEIDYGYDLYKISEEINFELSEKYQRLYPKALLNFKLKELKKKRVSFIIELESIVNSQIKEFLSSLENEFRSRTKSFMKKN